MKQALLLTTMMFLLGTIGCSEKDRYEVRTLDNRGRRFIIVDKWTGNFRRIYTSHNNDYSSQNYYFELDSFSLETEYSIAKQIDEK